MYLKVPEIVRIHVVAPYELDPVNLIFGVAQNEVLIRQRLLHLAYHHR